MHFSDIFLLNRNWIYTSVEDGHTGGYVLIRYKINPDHKIEWELIEQMRM